MKTKKNLVLIAVAILLVVSTAGCLPEIEELVEFYGVIKGEVWEDQDRNGVFTDGELRLSGVEVQLLNSKGEILRGVVTDSAGKYEFNDLLPTGAKMGEIFNFEIKVIPPPGKAFTDQGRRDVEYASHVDKAGFSGLFSVSLEDIIIINAGLMSPTPPTIDTPPNEPIDEDGEIDTPENTLNEPKEESEESTGEEIEEGTEDTSVRVGQLIGGHECGAQCNQLGMVYIESNSSIPVANATVTLTMTSPNGLSETMSAVTGQDGIAEFRFAVSSHADYTLAVESVEVEGLEYDPAQNQADSVVVGSTQQPLPDPGAVVVGAFLEPFEAAMQSADTGALLELLHPAVTELYGTEQCQAYLETVSDPGFDIELLSVSGTSPWEWEIDDQSTPIPDAYTANVNLTSRGQMSAIEIHFALDSENGVTWFSDCGDPLP